MKKIELLAPAKNLEAGTSAIDCGADAVYIGAARFGARASAGNSVSDIEQLTRYAHKYWARVYVALNTLLYDNEFPKVLRLISQLYEAGIDGLIVQDMGLLECDLPPLPLIASTQTHNITPEKVAFLENVGFQRVILARELSLKQIATIRASTNVELECFVHGALCVCYSGQCYMSYALGGRSGNRGECAQPCRKAYRLKDGKGQIIDPQRYFLSLKDMNRSTSLRNLLEAGISSFKIEGRLKDLAYVKNIVSYYRRRLDTALEGSDLSKRSSGTTRINFTPNPSKTFNRSYSSYFLNDNDEKIGSLYTPKSTGEVIGKISSLGKKSFTLKSPIDLHNGDGICFFDAENALRGTVINQVDGKQISPANMKGLAKGTLIYRNADLHFMKALKKSHVERRISVNLKFRETAGGFLLSACDEDGNRVEVELLTEKDTARKQDKMRESLQTQLTKCGATEFRCDELAIERETLSFLPASRLNALRRELLEKLTKTRAEQRPISYGAIIANTFPYPDPQLSYLGNVLNSKAEAFYRRHGVTQIEPAAESGLDLSGRKLMTTKYCLKRELGLCDKELTSSERLVEPLTLLDEQGREYLLRFNCISCEMEVFLER